MADEPIIPGAEPEDPETVEHIRVPDQVKYGICIFETTNELGEPVIHIHAPEEYRSISVGHLLRLLIYATKNLEAELIWQKFKHKAGENQIIRPGGR